MSLCPMIVSRETAVMPEAERKDLLLDLFQHQFMVVPHPDVFLCLTQINYSMLYCPGKSVPKIFIGF